MTKEEKGLSRRGFFGVAVATTAAAPTMLLPVAVETTAVFSQAMRLAIVGIDNSFLNFLGLDGLKRYIHTGDLTAFLEDVGHNQISYATCFPVEYIDTPVPFTALDAQVGLLNSIEFLKSKGLALADLTPEAFKLLRQEIGGIESEWMDTAINEQAILETLQQLRTQGITRWEDLQSLVFERTTPLAHAIIDGLQHYPDTRARQTAIHNILRLADYNLANASKAALDSQKTLRAAREKEPALLEPQKSNLRIIPRTNQNIRLLPPRKASTETSFQLILPQGKELNRFDIVRLLNQQDPRAAVPAFNLSRKKGMLVLSTANPSLIHFLTLCAMNQKQLPLRPKPSSSLAQPQPPSA